MKTPSRIGSLYKCAALMLLALGTQQSMAQICITSSTGDDIIGTQGGYRHELWNQNKKGKACMTLGSTAAAFNAEWGDNSGNIDNFLARRGLGYDDTQKHYQIGSFNTSYNVTYSPNCSSGNSYMGVYGWTYDSTKSSPNDLVEWYIVENWCNWNPSLADNTQFMGTIYGDEYDVYKLQRTGPSIKGDRTFMQYFSIRKNVRTSGLLNITQHFFAWEKLGMAMGNMHEVSMLVEGYQNRGTANFTSLDVYKTNEVWASTIDLPANSYSITVGEKTGGIPYTWSPAGSTVGDVKITSSNTSVVSIGDYKGNLFLQGIAPGTATITITSLSAPRPGQAADTATVTVTNALNSLIAQNVEFRAMGTTGTERINLLLNGQPVGQQWKLTKTFQTYKDTIFGAGDLTVEFLNDDGQQAGSRDVRLDYISVNGVKRETEAQAVNSARYVNGVCGGGGYSEWLNCNGAVNFGRVENAHKIAIRARGNAGGEHITLLLDGQPVNSGWTLGTTFQEYSVTLNRVDGDINVRYDNDGASRDAVIDWVKVDNQNVRQAENMQYNTGLFANGRCGGGSYSEWLHCNGVIGFGKISDNFN